MDRGAEALRMIVRYTRQATRSAAMLPLIVAAVAVIPFLGNARPLHSHLDEPFVAVCLSAALLILAAVVWFSLANAREYFFLHKRPAIAFEEQAMYVRRVGRIEMTEFRYDNIAGFRIDEIQGKSSISRYLVITTKQGKTGRYCCDSMDMTDRDIVRQLMRNTPDISYQGGPTG